MKKANRRYYLHRRLKKDAIKYNPHTHTIFVGFNETVDNKYINAAREEFNYSVQYEIN